MVNDSFSKWPGAWERHLIRRYQHPHFFESCKPPSAQDISEAQSRDQQELGQFHLSLQSLIRRCTDLTTETSAASITAIKKELDSCHDTAFSLAADLTEQKTAIATLNEVITSAMRRALTGEDEALRLQLIKDEAKRMAKLSRLEHPIVSDLLRSISPIPQGQLTAALLCESDKAYKAALEVLSTNRKNYLATRIDTIMKSLNSEKFLTQANRKRELLLKQLPDLPMTNDEPVPG